MQYGKLFITKKKKPAYCPPSPLNVLVLMIYLKHLGHCRVSVHMITMVTVQQGVAEVESITHV